MSWHKRALSRQADRTEWYLWDDDGNVALETEWDVEPVIEAAKAVFNEFDTTKGWKGDMHHVASIPMCVLEDYKRTHGANLLQDKARLRAFVNDPSNSFLRTRPGRI